MTDYTALGPAGFTRGRTMIQDSYPGVLYDRSRPLVTGNEIRISTHWQQMNEVTEATTAPTGYVPAHGNATQNKKPIISENAQAWTRYEPPEARYPLFAASPHQRDTKPNTIGGEYARAQEQPEAARRTRPEARIPDYQHTQRRSAYPAESDDTSIMDEPHQLR